jgi:crotonobetainyl-CoA:carnitine CoA-transferase CaiB-like acyl-CoA transferase
MTYPEAEPPLAGLRVIERARGAAAAYAGRLLAALGAHTVMIEEEGGTPLRREPPLLDGAGDTGALFAYLAAGKHSLVCDPRRDAGRRMLHAQLATADILIDDTPLDERESQELGADLIGQRHPHLVHVSVLPFGAHGAKAGWRGEEIQLIHAGGEGFLLPNGLSQALFPQRPPLKIHGYFANYQGGATAAMAAMAALRMLPTVGGQFVDVSIQDATVAVGSFAIQRLGDGSLEHRSTRSFRYGGVFETRDGHIELLMLEDRQWEAFAEVMGRPAWTQDPALGDPLERSRRGAELNEHIRAWMRTRSSAEVVAAAQARGVPVAPYFTPDQVLNGRHERERGLFERTSLPDGSQADILVAPFHFTGTPLHLQGAVPSLDSAAARRAASTTEAAR